MGTVLHDCNSFGSVFYPSFNQIIHVYGTTLTNISANSPQSVLPIIHT